MTPRHAESFSSLPYSLLIALFTGALFSAAMCAEPEPAHRFSGEQDGQYSGGEYHSDTTTIVRQGRELAVASGAIIRFKRYSGLRVEGRLICRGTPESPVVFCASGQAGAPGQWNGITVGDSGEIDLDYVKILGSVLSLTLGRGSRARIGHTIFDDNLHADITMPDSTVSFPNGIAGLWTYNLSPTPRQQLERRAQPARKSDGSSWLLPLQVGCGSLALGGGVLWVFFDRLVAANQKKFDRAQTPVDAERFHSARDQAVSWRTAGALLCGVGTAGLAVSVTLPIMNRKPNAP